jgi:uncharacterized protein (TIGR02996 family)
MKTEQDALYRAVCEQPDDDTPRLIFADYVEETGDTVRAAFIRTQIELARVPEHDPVWSRCRQLDPNAILGWSLSYPLPELPAGMSWRGHRVRRGFSWKASVADAGAFPVAAAKLFGSAPIQALDLDHSCGIHKALLRFAECPQLKALRRLEFSLTRFDPREIGILVESQHLSHLKEMAFAQHAITAEGLQALSGSALFATLAELELERAALSPALVVDALGAATKANLRKLVISECLLPAPDAAHLVALPLVEGLECLDLGDNPLRSEGVRAVAESERLGRLEVLNLRGTIPGVPGVQALAESQSLHCLRWLDLTSNRLGPVAVRLLAQSSLGRGLAVLDLSGNPIGNAGATTLGESMNLERMQELVLRDCSIEDDGALALAGSPHLDRLLRLDLRGNPGIGPAAQRKLRDRFGRLVAIGLQ